MIIFIIAILIAAIITFFMIRKENNKEFDEWRINRRCSELIDEYNILIKNIETEQNGIMSCSNWNQAFADNFCSTLKDVHSIIEECHKLNELMISYEEKQELKKYKKTEDLFEEKLAELNVSYYKLTSLHERMNNIQEKQQTITFAFFDGCETLEGMNKRYRSLVKIYHPDAENGNSEIFQKIKDEYDEKVKSINKKEEA